MTRVLGYAFAAITLGIAAAMVGLQVLILWTILPHSPFLGALIVAAIAFEIWAYRFDRKYS